MQIACRGNPQRLGLEALSGRREGRLLEAIEGVDGLGDRRMQVPTFVFRVGSERADRLRAAAGEEGEEDIVSGGDPETGPLWAFHGTPGENVHSVLYHGLQQHLNKVF